MNVAVIYATKTKHSKKIAESIANALNVDALDVRSSPVLSGVDLLYIVGGIYGGQSLPVLLNYVGTLDGSNIKQAVLITSCASKKSPQTQVRQRLQQKGINVLEEEFLCQGSFLFLSMGHPNKLDLENAAAFALQIRERS